MLGILPRCSSQTYSPLQSSTPSANRFDAELAAFEQAASGSNAPAEAVALGRAYALRNKISDSASLTHFFEGVATSAENLQVREEAQRYVALMRLHAGNLHGAQTEWTSLGVVRDWSVLGPFAGEPPAGGQFDPTTDYTQGGVTRHWRSAPPMGPRGLMDLSHLFPGVQSGTIGLAAVIQTETPRAAALKFGAASAVKVFVNGEQVFDAGETKFAFDEHSAPIHLNAGTNRIVIAVRRSGTADTDAQPWLFTARLASADGEDLLAEADRAADADENSVAALDTLAGMQELRGRAQAHDTYERAARMAPSADRWLHVAQTCGNVNCTFAALSQAKALAPNDATASARLAYYYILRKQNERAAQLLAQAAVVSPNDFVIAAMRANLLADQGKKAEALVALRAFSKRFPDVPWLQGYVAPQLEQLGLLGDAARVYQSELTRDFDNPQVRAALSRVYGHTQNVAALRTLYRDSIALDPTDTQAMAALANLDAGTGNAAAAAAELHNAALISPDSAHLRNALATVYFAEDQDASADNALNSAIASHPADSELRVRAQLDGDNTAPADEERPYTVDVAALAAQAHATPPSGRAEAIELADVRIVHVEEDGDHSVRAQQATLIGSESGARDYSTRSVSYSPRYQTLHILHARVFKTDGTVIPADDLGDSGPGDSVASMYYDSRTHTVRYPDLERGDVVEFDYRLEPKRNPYGDYFSELQTFGSSIPTKLQRYVVIAPAARPLHITAERLAAAHETESDTEHAYAWEMHDIAPLPSEPKEPATTEIAPYVHVSTLDSWAEVGRWYAQLIAPQMKLDATLRTVLQNLIAGKTTDEEKIRAIHQFVLRNTHYVALEFGIFNYKPYPVSQVYARRFGDCKDKSSLMIALLHAAGIDADLALVRTRRLGDVSPEATSVSVFNHAVVYIPKYDLWLDGTAEYAGTHELPIDDQGAQALTVSLDGNAQLRRIPVSLPMENYTHRQVRAELQPNGEIEFTGSAYTRGEDAPGLRRDFEVTEQQRASFQNHLAEVLPSVRLDSVEVDGAQDLESDVIVNFSGDLDTYSGARNVSLATSWMKRSYVRTLAAMPSRSEDLQLPAPWTTEEELHFVVPQGAKVISLPQDTNLNTPFGSAVVRYERRDGEVIVRTFVQFRQIDISPAEYGAFRDFCFRIDDAFRQKIRVGL